MGLQRREGTFVQRRNDHLPILVRGRPVYLIRLLIYLCSNKLVTKHHLTDHQRTRGCKEKRKDNRIPATMID